MKLLTADGIDAGCLDNGTVREAESRADDGCCRRAGVDAARGDAVTASPPLRARALALGGDLVPRSPSEAILFSEAAAYRAFAVAQRRSGPTSRAMRRRCWARCSRTPIRTEYGVRTTAVCTVPRCRIRRRRRPRSCYCDDGATCRSISNSIRTSSPVTGRS